MIESASDQKNEDNGNGEEMADINEFDIREFVSEDVSQHHYEPKLTKQKTGSE